MIPKSSAQVYPNAITPPRIRYPVYVPPPDCPIDLNSIAFIIELWKSQKHFKKQSCSLPIQTAASRI
jgi:hypothetical protein